MDRKHSRAGFTPHVLAAVTLLAAAGCGDDVTPVPRASYSPRPVPTRRATVEAPSSRQAEAGPPAAADALAPGGKWADPLTDTDDKFEVDDGLASASGPAMPTKHSHWLRGRVFNAHVAVQLNGHFLGEYFAPLDKDITMKLHSGINTVTFTYHPLTTKAFARIDLLEGEHTPPVAPCASFQSPDTATSQGGGISPASPATTHTATFIAR